MTVDQREAPPCPNSANGEHDWIDITTMNDQEQRFLCAVCEMQSSLPLGQSTTLAETQ